MVEKHQGELSFILLLSMEALARRSPGAKKTVPVLVLHVLTTYQIIKGPEIRKL